MVAKTSKKRSKPKKRVKKSRRKEPKLPEIRAPSPAKLVGKLVARNLLVVFAVIIIAVIVSGLAFMAINKASEIKEKKALEKKLLGYEEAINGTQILVTKDTIEQLVASGTTPVPKERVLSPATNDYICTITTDKGIITLKKRGSLMREEVIRENHNLSVLFIGEKFYMYHPKYNVWAMFPYDAEKATSNDVHRYMAFSLNELMAINGTDYVCVETALPEGEFSLGDIEIIDAVEFLSSLSFLR